MFGLGFLAPAFLAGILAVAIPIALHLFRRRTDRVVDFAAVQMLPDAPVERQQRRRLHDLLLLALRVAAIALLAVSFARPYFEGGQVPLAAPTTIVVLDTSLSMTAPEQWAEAVRVAGEAIDAVPATHHVGVVTFDDRAGLAVPPTADRAAARAFLAGVRPGGGGTSFSVALATAADALGAAGGRVVVVSDLQQAGWERPDRGGLPDGVELQVVPVASPSANLAVTSVRKQGTAVTAVVQSFAHGPRTVVARASVAGTPLATSRVDIAPEASTEVRFEAAWPASGAVAVTIDDAEGYAGDNARYWPLEPTAPTSFLVLTADPPEAETTGLYVQRALEAASDTGAANVRVTDGRRFAVDGAAGVPSAIFVVGTRTLDRQGRAELAAYLTNGGRVFLSLGPDIDVPSLTEVLGVAVRLAPDPVDATGQEAAIVPADRRHPVLRQLTGPASSLGRLPIERYRRVLDESGWEVLARFAGGALALAERPVGRGVLMVFASDLDNRWNRFPLEPSFAPFMVEAGRYLTGDAQMASTFTLPDVPPGVPATAGVHDVPGADGRPSRMVVVNVSPKESDPTALSPEAFAALVPRTGVLPPAPEGEAARTQEEAQRLWQLGLLAMLAVLVVEGVVGRRWRTARPLDLKVG